MKRAERDHERGLFFAWQTALFVGQAFVGKLQPLAEVLAPFRQTDRLQPISKESLEAAMQMIGLAGRPVSEASRRAMRFRES